MDTKKSTGIVFGVIGLFLLVLPMCLLACNIDPELIFMVSITSWVFTIASVGITASSLGSSTVFGALFIFSGLLNLFFWATFFGESLWKPLEARALWVFLVLNAPSLAAILVGVFLIKKIQESTKQILNRFSVHMHVQYDRQPTIVKSIIKIAKYYILSSVLLFPFNFIFAAVLGEPSDLAIIAIYLAIAGIETILITCFFYTRKLKERKKREKKVLAWELEDQLEELKEQLSLGHITQEEYERKKKKLLEKSGK